MKTVMRWYIVIFLLFPRPLICTPTNSPLQATTESSFIESTNDFLGIKKKSKKSRKKKSKQPKQEAPKPRIYQYQLAIGTMFKNEARWLREWLEYHLLIGVEHFYLYNNDSTDNFDEVLEPYIQSGVVELIDWDSNKAPWISPGQNYHWVGYQLSAFNDCTTRAMNKVQWLAIMDVDEFLVPGGGSQVLQRHLHNAANSNIGTLTFLWKCFGTSYLWDIPEDQLMTEALILRTENSFPANAIGKCIHRPEAISFCRIHDAELKPEYRQSFIWDVQINHYQLRGRKDAFAKRLNIQVNSEKELETLPVDILGWLNDREKEYNCIEDRIIAQYLPKLKRAVFSQQR